jgi:hypothetical protein
MTEEEEGVNASIEAGLHAQKALVAHIKEKRLCDMEYAIGNLQQKTQVMSDQIIELHRMIVDMKKENEK